MFEQLTDLELLGAFITVFVLNIIPFMGPSNLLIAMNVTSLFALDPLAVGLIVAGGATAAKSIHYLAIFFLRKVIGQDKSVRLDKYFSKIGRWAFAANFAVAATPLPDEPIMIPMALMKYNPVKFCVSYFLGKFAIGLPGAYLGFITRSLVGSSFGNVAVVLASITLTSLIMVIVMKVDVDTLIVRSQKIISRLCYTRSKTAEEKPPY
ncbi:MAG: hypothetical protein QXJ75_00275 [Candidatus Bathyarchaeia archaeon]